MSKRPGRSSKASGLPSKADIRKFVEESPTRVGRREIARAFNITGADRPALKKLLVDMREAGELGPRPARHGAAEEKGGLPSVTVLEVTGQDIDGELLAVPLRWRRRVPPPQIVIAGDARQTGQPVGVGDRVLARLSPAEDGYLATVMRRLSITDGARKILGVYQRVGRDGRVQPVEKGREEIAIAHEDAQGARSGELVLVTLESSGRGGGLRRGKVIEKLGSVADARSVSLIAIYEHGIPVEFSEAALEAAQAARPPELGARTDLREFPFVTIDPADARDHDDAVWAEADQDPDNPGGWVVYVAIADVACFVQPGSVLDGEALKRGNSTYFPDRVVPMLPELLSGGLCSLHEGEDRACMVVRMVFDAAGNKLRHKFIRSLIQSRASLTYAQVQAAEDGTPDAVTAPLYETVIAPLYGAYRALAKARDARHPLALEMPERRIQLDEDGHVASIAVARRLDAHQLIEEFMIAANVCAAEELERHHVPCMYRVHEEPALEKLESLREFLKSMGYELARGQLLTPEIFNRILAKAAGTEHAHVINQVVLRAQSQAHYSPENHGHFGLALPRYAHFTSPIRRYADILVHRGLIRACKFGDDGLPAGQDMAVLKEIGEQISAHERRSMAAERDSADRYLAAYLSDRVGAEFEGVISGVTRFGLFVSLDETGADGLVPIASLGDDYYDHEEALHALVGRRTGKFYHLGDAVTVRLLEAVPVTGGLRFELLSVESTSRPQPVRQSPRGKPRVRAGKPKTKLPPRKSKKKARKR